MAPAFAGTTAQFDVAQQDLSGALQQFSRQANIQILYPSEVAAKRIAPALHGDMSTKTALSKLLTGSNLRIARLDGRVAVLAERAVASTDVSSDASVSPAGDAVETVVVNGYIESLNKAQRQKRDAAIITDVVVSEDAAKFPELNLAEALQRLPGIAINREAGEGRRISLRGLGPDYSRVQLNGMEVLGNVDSPQDSRTQRSRDRAFDFNMFASELFTKAEIEKSYQAAQSEGGMAGTIGLFTPKPLDGAPGLQATTSVKLGTNTYTKDFQPRVVGLLGYNWEDKLGALVTLSVSKRKTQEQGYNTYEATQESSSKYDTFISSGGSIANLSTEDQDKFLSGDLYWQEGNRLSVWDAKQTRMGLTATVQWKPVDDLLVTFDFLKSRFHMGRDEYHLATRAASPDDEIIWNSGYSEYGRTFSASVFNALEYDKANYVTYANVDNAIFGSEHRHEINTNNFEQKVLSFSWTPVENLKIDGHAGTEDSTYKTPKDDQIYLQAVGGMTARYWSNGNSGTNTYDWDTADFSNWWVRDARCKEYGQYTTFRDAGVDASYDVAEALTLRAGYLFRNYKNGGFERYGSTIYDPFYGYNYTSASDARVFRDYNGQSWVTADFTGMYKEYGLSHDVSSGTDKNKFTVGEATDAEYLQADWNAELFGFDIMGNAGVRAYQTTVTNEGYVKDEDSSLTYQKIVSDYSGILPTFNVAVSLTDSIKLRAAYARNINRPSLGAMKMTGSVSYSNGNYTVSNGNPYLKPYTSDNYDLSLEYYFGKVGMAALGLFHKDIQNLSTSVTEENVLYSRTGLSTELAEGLTDDTVISEYTYYINSGNAGLSGIEMALQRDFDFLPAPFDRLGTAINMTLVTSHYIYGGTSQPMTGMSNESANVTLYYETEKWGVRSSINYRSGYLRKNYDGSSPSSSDGFKSTIYMDAAAFYNLADGMQLTFDAINLLNTREVQWNTPWKELHNETTSGTTAMLGISYKY